MTEMVFRREDVRAFRFVRCGFDAASGEARLVYALDDGPELVEIVRFPGAPFVLDEAHQVPELAGQFFSIAHRPLGFEQFFVGVDHISRVCNAS